MDRTHIPRSLQSASICTTRLTTLCLENNTRFSRCHGPLFDEELAPLLRNNPGLTRIHIRGFHFSGICFEECRNTSLIKSLRIVSCRCVSPYFFNNFIRLTVNLEEFLMSGCLGESRLSRNALDGLIRNGSDLRRVFLDNGENSFDKHQITQLLIRKRSLNEIHISDYNLTRENINNLPKIRKLSLNNVAFNSSDYFNLRRRFINITSLRLCSVSVNDVVLNVFKFIQGLNTLFLRDCNFDIVSETAEGMINLECLFIESCTGVNEILVREIVKCRKLLKLSFHENYGVSMLGFFRALRSMTSLTLLSASDFIDIEEYDAIPLYIRQRRDSSTFRNS